MKFQVNANENQSRIGAACQLPGNKFFHYGGCSPYNNTGYIIDLLNHDVESVSALRPRSNSSATYFDNSV